MIDGEEGEMDDEVGCGGVQIVKSNPSIHKFELQEGSLERLLMAENVRDRNVVVVSVAGAFRKGKSFLLDFFLRYLDARYKKYEKGDWLGPDDVPLKGFKWKGGSERVTSGIIMWSDVYLARTASGVEVAIILLDTQGAFDSNSTVCECATIFALSTMLSSVQIYNISQNIQEDDLQHLQLFAEYGKLALADSGRVPFQKLLFLVRDWSSPYEADYGAAGGQKLLDKRLQTTPGQHIELQYLRRHIRSCFTDIGCYLMPHPGLKVATNPSFDGRLRDIEPQFTECVRDLAPMLLAPENLTLKMIGGQPVKAKELYLYFSSYTKLFGGDELPEPKCMLMVTAEANNLTALAAAKELYLVGMDKFAGASAPYMKLALLQEEHARLKTAAFVQFAKKRKMGGEELSDKYRNQLDTDLDKLFTHFRLHNESKNVFKAARTPAVFMTVAIASYIMSGVFGLITLYTMSGLCNLVTGLCVITLLTWTYTKYTGDHIPVSLCIDNMADQLWERFFKPFSLNFTQHALEQTLVVTSDVMK